MDIKICGIKTVEAAQIAVQSGATHLGFIFFEKSPRHTTAQNAGDIARKIGAKAKTVAVTVNASDGELDEIIDGMKPDILQLHGRETAQRVLELKARYALPIIKAFPISTRQDLDQIAPYQNIVDAFLFDAKPPKGAKLPGGNAVSFDWDLLNHLPENLNYFLAGGLHRDNIQRAISIAKPPAIDISSGVESEPGVKDLEMITEFFIACKNA